MHGSPAIVFFVSIGLEALFQLGRAVEVAVGFSLVATEAPLVPSGTMLWQEQKSQPNQEPKSLVVGSPHLLGACFTRESHCAPQGKQKCESPQEPKCYRVLQLWLAIEFTKKMSPLKFPKSQTCHLADVFFLKDGLGSHESLPKNPKLNLLIFASRKHRTLVHADVFFPKMEWIFPPTRSFPPRASKISCKRP